jgi:membrane associated rhomboid family serine protease
VIPLYDDVRTRRVPVVTLALIAANVAVFAFELTLPRHGMTLGGFYARAGVTPYELARHADVPPRDIVPVWGTLLTSMFVHGGWLHLIFNMLYLWIFGNNVEDALGRVRFLGFYVVCGMVATMAQVLVDTTSMAPVIGASGAIAGVLGAYIVLYPRARVISVVPLLFVFPVFEVPAWILLGLWFALQALQGVLALHHPDVGVAFFAHVGGFVAGALLALAFGRRKPSAAGAASRRPAGRGARRV